MKNFIIFVVGFVFCFWIGSMVAPHFIGYPESSLWDALSGEMDRKHNAACLVFSLICGFVGSVVCICLFEDKENKNKDNSAKNS